MLHVSYVPKVINAAIEIQLFELLSEKDLSLTISESDYSLNDISERLDTEKSVTEALLNVLSKIGLISIEKGIYGLTALAQDYLLKTSEANQLRKIQHFNGSNGPFDLLPQALNGKTPDFDGKMWSSKKASIGMEQGMKPGGLQNVIPFVKTIPEFESCSKMCDLAGNTGYYSYALMQENSKLQSHVYELPEVCKIAKELKQNEPNFNRVTYHEIDVKTADDFGEGYDLFFISHYLYEFGNNGELVNFKKKVNRAMKPGGIFISHHTCDNAVNKEEELTISLVELQTRIMGYSTHQLPETVLKDALIEAGFDNFRVKQPDGSCAFSTLLFSAIKNS